MNVLTSKATMCQTYRVDRICTRVSLAATSRTVHRAVKVPFLSFQSYLWIVAYIIVQNRKAFSVWHVKNDSDSDLFPATTNPQPGPNSTIKRTSAADGTI